MPVAESAEQGSRPPVDEAHRRLLEDDSIQFTMEPFQPEPAPAWLRWLAEALGEIWPAIRILFWLGVAALGAYLLYQLARRLAGESWPWRRPQAAEAAAEWRPEAGPARALLAEADGLAAADRFDEAARLLLFRSIEDIEARRPQLVRPALTSRDIALAPDLPAGPRQAFQSIVAMVERSLFGGRRLARPDWERCRSAYETFAFSGGWTR